MAFLFDWFSKNEIKSKVGISYSTHKILGPADKHIIVPDFTKDAIIEAMIKAGHMDMAEKHRVTISTELGKFEALYFHTAYDPVLSVSKDVNLPDNTLCIRV